MLQTPACIPICSQRRSCELFPAGDVAGALKLLARVLQRAKAGQEAVGSCQDPKQSPEQYSAWDNQVPTVCILS